MRVTKVMVKTGNTYVTIRSECNDNEYIIVHIPMECNVENPNTHNLNLKPRGGE